MAAQAARHLQGGDACLWSRSKQQLADIRKSSENCVYLPDILLPEGLQFEKDLFAATKRLSSDDLVGLELAAGKSLPKILASLGHVAEGALCAAAVRDLAVRLGVEMPITAMMGKVLAGKIKPHDAVRKLMGRDPKIES